MNKYKQFSKVNNEDGSAQIDIKALTEFRIMPLEDLSLELTGEIKGHMSKQDMVNYVFGTCAHKPVFDYALPLAWINAMREFNNNIIGIIPGEQGLSVHFVWCYPSGAMRNSGYALPLTLEGLMLISAYSMFQGN